MYRVVFSKEMKHIYVVGVGAVTDLARDPH
jgi:hypothetical protein